jgi:hypothetical protein
MCSNERKLSYLCRCITLGALLKIVPAGFFKKKTIYYFYPSKISSFIERCGFLVPFFSGRIIIEQFDCNLNEMYTSDSKPLADMVHYDVLYRIVDGVDANILRSKYSLLNFLNSKLYKVKDDLILYIKHRITMNILDDLLMVEVSNWLASNSKSKLFGRDLTLFLSKKSYWTDLVFRYAREKNVPLVYLNSLSPRDSEFVKITYCLLNLYVKSVKTLFKAWRVKPSETNSKVGIPFYIHNNLTEFLNKRNYYLFWYPDSNLDSGRIVIYFDDDMVANEYNISEGERKNIEFMGFKLFSIRNWFEKARSGVVQYQCSLRVVLLACQYLKELARLSCKINSRERFGEFKILAKLFLRLPYWEDFFLQNNIKIKFRFDEMFSHRDIAAKLSDVVVISYQYSNHSRTMILHQDICDIFFIWGKEYEKLYSNRHSSCNNIIQSGYIFDYVFNEISSSGRPIREDLDNSGMDFVISIFDESFGSNLIYSIKSEMLAFYSKIFEYALRERGVGIIIKPKKDNSLHYLRSSKQTSDLLSLLEQKKKIQILASSRFPVEAGKASDLVIGLIAESTAAFECCLSGIPAILYDCSKKRDSYPVYKWGRNKVVFDDIATMLECIEEFRENGMLRNGFADWSSVIHKMDPFQDGGASQRIGLYIDTLLLGIDNGSTKEESIENANRIYSERFGSDKVASVCSTNGDVLKSEKEKHVHVT